MSLCVSLIQVCSNCVLIKQVSVEQIKKSHCKYLFKTKCSFLDNKYKISITS